MVYSGKKYDSFDFFAKNTYLSKMLLDFYNIKLAFCEQTIKILVNFFFEFIVHKNIYCRAF